MNTFFKKYTPFLQQVDYFFVLEIFGSVLRGSLLAVDPATKQIEISNLMQCECADSPPEAFADAIPALVKKFNLPASTRVLALLDHRRAAVVSAPVSLMRSDPQAEIRQAEMENLVSQGLWKLINVHRRMVAQAMGIPETRVRLADADVMQVKLDNHRVVNPLGFAARSAEIWYRETFVDELLLRRLEGALTEDNLAAVVEAPAMLAQLVARVRPQETFLFISVGARETLVYQIDHLSCAYADSFSWGVDTLLAGVAKYFGMTEEAAAKLLAQYSANEVSPAVRKAVETAASGELAILSNGIAAHQPSARLGRGAALPVYVHGVLALPTFLFDTAFTRRLGLSLTLTSVNERFIGEQTGFVVQLSKSGIVSGSRYTFDAALAVVADSYAVSALPLISRAAKQRARWS